PAAYIDQLFRLDGTFNRKGTDMEPGTGLGLILCKEFVALMKGMITLESRENEGTTVCLTLPAGH
ncbi:MAG: ATP-binding protein, partial [Bacteroidota bacterium]